MSPAYLASIPSPDRGVWEVGPFPLRAYALCIIAGIVVAVVWGQRRWSERGGAEGTVADVAIFAVPLGLIGGRLYHVVSDWDPYFGDDGDLGEILKVWEGGLGIWGAIAGGALGAWIACRRRGIPLAAFADALGPPILLAQVIGRIGNWFNQELYGDHTGLPWGLKIYTRIDPDNGRVDTLDGIAQGPAIDTVHPTFLYEMVWNIGIVALVVWADRRWRLGGGRVFALYVAGYTAGRFWIELMRTDPAHEWFGVRMNVWVAAGVFVLAVAYFAVRRDVAREDPATLGGTLDDRDRAPVALEKPGPDEPDPSPATTTPPPD